MRKNKINILISISFLLLGFNILNSTELIGKNRPNFLIIMVDDISPSEFGCYGNKDYETPNIDALAYEGVYFNMAWATPMCSPTRALMTTGRYPSRTGVWHNDLRIKVGDYGRWNYAKGHYTFARLLSENGYQTAISGKPMALGDSEKSENVGFDEHYIHIDENIKLPKDGSFDGLFEGKWNFPGSLPVPSRFWHPAIVNNGELVETSLYDFGPDLYTDFVIDFMKRNKDGPFLAYFPMNLVHDIAGGGLPTLPKNGLPGKNKGGDLTELNLYVDMLVGRLVNALDALELRDNTIVFFASDNGTSGASKMHATEEGPRVPFIVNCPGIIKKRGATNALMEFADILPTLLDYSDTNLPEGYEVDGLSMKPFLDGTLENYRDSIVSYIATARMVRTKDWLLEAVDPVYGSPTGRLYFCDGSFSKSEYKLITDFSKNSALRNREMMLSILDRIPFPDMTIPIVKEEVKNYDSMPYKHYLKKGEKLKKIHP